MNLDTLSEEQRNLLIACSLYKKDPVLFVKQILQAEPTPQQESVLKEIANPNARISIRSIS